MFEIDREAFGKFISEQRKAKGLTQKELAAKLFISDKAVSKWERGISLPDITLLTPLSEILEVTVTELLEGRMLEKGDSLDTEQVETIVRKALSFSDEVPGIPWEKRKKNIITFLGFALCALAELLLTWLFRRRDIGTDLLVYGLPDHVYLMEGLSFVFGIHFWIFMKEQLPEYYDSHRVSIYASGLFRMSIPGVYFNNHNWPHIVKGLKTWSAITMVTVPAMSFLFSLIIPYETVLFTVQQVILLFYLLGLFAPIYILGKKFGR